MHRKDSDGDITYRVPNKTIECLRNGVLPEQELSNLCCQAVGLATVPRATHDKDGIRKLLGFTNKQLPIMNNPVGYEKK